MDLSSMLAREDFFPLFFATLKEYYQEVYGRDIEIGFADKKDCNLVIQPRLSAAVSPRISAKARQFFYAEWNVRGSFWKYAAGKLLVFGLTHTGKAFSSYQLKLLPEDAVTADLVIAPNNRSVRVFDYAEGTVGCMIKKGFTDKYFSNQLAFRKTFDYPFMVPMLRHSQRWFVEPILQGHPLARVTDAQAYQKGMADALEGIRMLAEDTLEYTDAKAYLDSLLDSIRTRTAKAVEVKHIRTADAVAALCRECFDRANAVFGKIPLCMSHGDFQSGNIWVDKSGKTYIYDWETAGKRSAWYDSAVLAYSLRRANGWGTLAQNAMPEQLLNCDPVKARPEQEYRAIKGIVLLEDLLFYLEDMLELPNDWGAEIFDSAVERLRQVEL